MPIRGNTPSLRDEAGQGLVEFALVLPLLLILIFGIFDFGRAINYWIDETHLANQAARFASVNRKPDYCAGDSLPVCVAKQGTSKELREGSSQVTAPLKVCIEYPDGPDVGDVVRVTATATYKFLPFLGGIGQVDIKGQAQMRLEARPNDIAAECSS